MHGAENGSVRGRYPCAGLTAIQIRLLCNVEMINSPVLVSLGKAPQSFALDLVRGELRQLVGHEISVETYLEIEQGDVRGKDVETNAIPSSKYRSGNGEIVYVESEATDHVLIDNVTHILHDRALTLPSGRHQAFNHILGDLGIE